MADLAEEQELKLQTFLGEAYLLSFQDLWQEGFLCLSILLKNLTVHLHCVNLTFM